jgi:hypothetical protein
MNHRLFTLLPLVAATALAVLVHGLMKRQRLKLWLNHADAEIAAAGV